MKTSEGNLMQLDGPNDSEPNVAVSARAVIAMGNMLQGDDGAALYAVRKLQTKKIEDMRIWEIQKDGSDLLRAIKDFPCIYLISTVVSGKRPGYVYRFDLLHDPLPDYLFSPCSDLHLELLNALEQVRTNEHLPDKIILYAIEGTDFTPGAPLSREVEMGMQTVVQCLMVDLG